MDVQDTNLRTYYGFGPDPTDEDLSAIPAIVEDLVDFAVTEGPFDGVIGFSEGGRVAAMMMIREAQHATATLKCGIFFCALSPIDLAAVLQKNGRIRLLNRAFDGILVNVPTAHIWSKSGDIYPGMGQDLVGLCQAGLREEVIHDLGHSVPGARGSNGLKETIRAIERTIERAKELL